MEYREIVAVTGIGGLFQLLATKSDGAIVRNLTDKSVKFIPARVHNVTPIESIEIYTTEDNVRLHKVLQAMKDTAATTAPVDAKKAGNNDIKAYFKAVFPSMDEERVYVSDMKKILKWYELLKENDLLNFDQYEQAEGAEEAADVEVVAEAPAKPAKKKAAETAETAAEEAPAKPAKKARAKKADAEDASADAAEKPAKKTAAKKKKTEE